MRSSDLRRAERASRIYRERWGWNPLPTFLSRKRPLVPYAHLWESESSDADWRPTTNLQLMTGCRWGLAVIDLDGEIGLQAWEAISLYRPTLPTWTVRTPSGNWHLWFTIPSGVTELRKRCLWSGGHHQAIELLGDRSLVVAPPSLDLATGRRYEFVLGPRTLPRPAELPAWVIDYAVAPVRPPYLPPTPTRASLPSPLGVYHWRDVARAIPSKANLAYSWGLRLTGRMTNAGWLECRSLFREDRRASAGFHPESGYYSEPEDYRLSIFELGVVFGRYKCWQDACNDLGRKYLGANA